MFSIEHEGYRGEPYKGTTEEVSRTRNFMSEDMSQTEESLAKMSLERTGDENDDHNILPSQQSKSQECDSEFPNTIMENDEKRRYMSQNVVKTDDHDPRSLSKDESMQNDEIGGLISQHRAKTAESNTLSQQLMQEEIDKKEDFLSQKMHTSEKVNSESRVCTSIVDGSFLETGSESCQEKQGKYFFYDSPLHEETGLWIPVSIPPMSESDHQEWTRGFSSNGGYLPETDSGWGDCLGEGKELTMWDVVVEMLTAARGKVNALASGEIPQISWISNDVIEQAWKEIAQTLTESSLSNVQEILETAPPKWLPDSTASACMLCSVRFHPIMCTRHHCRFCGGIFCSDCTRGRSLLPEKFQTADPQRVCDVCCVRLESVQPYLMDQVSRAAQLPTHDLTDLSTLRSWVNFPWGQSMEYEIYKATNTIRGYSKVGSLRPEKRIPEAILRHAKGLAILTIVKVGVMVTYNIGTGLVIARREDGSWSPPSAILSFGVGWGAQAGGELTDLIIVLRSDDAIRTFSGNNHLSLGAGLSAAIGVIGRTAEADLRAGTSGYAACYTYSCSKGAFLGCSLEGSIVTTRTQENSRFYGSQSITASDILLGALPKPPAASILYRALGDLYDKL